MEDSSPRQQGKTTGLNSKESYLTLLIEKRCFFHVTAVSKVSGVAYYYIEPGRIRENIQRRP